MICKPCGNAADRGEEGLRLHFEAGCPAIDMTLNPKEANVVNIDGRLYIVDTSRCDCQHRDDLPKRELKASEV